MNLLSFQRSSARWLAAAVATGIGVLHVSNAAESPPATTNAPSVTLDALVADVLEHNPELNFYRAEMAAARASAAPLRHGQILKPRRRLGKSR